MNTNSENWKSVHSGVSVIPGDDEARRMNFVSCVYNTLEIIEDVKLSMKKLDEIVGDEMEKEWTEFAYNPTDVGLDTCVYEEVLDLISDYYLGIPWPTYGDNISIDEYMTDLKNTIEASWHFI